MAIGNFGETFPYTNFHDLNLDWVIKMIKETNDKLDTYIAQSESIKFADPIEWNINTEYAKLYVVVSDNIGYLSKKAVPAGINIDNTEYWEPVFDMSSLMSALSSLQDEVTSQGSDIESLQTAVGEQGPAISALQTTVGEQGTALGSLQTTVGQQGTDINSLKTGTVKNNSTKHLLYLGDSYTTWYANQLYNTVVAGIGIPAAQCHNVSVSGASFSDASNSFLMQVQGYTGNRNAITDILVVGGINDALLAYDNYLNVWPDTSALQAAISNFVTYCRSNYPNAVIHFAYVGGTLANSTYYNTLHPAKSQEWALWAYTVYAQSLGVDVLNTYNAMHLSPNNYYEDGLHPNQNYGIVAIAQDIIATFNGQEPMHNRPTKLVSIDASGISSSGSMAGFMRIVNDEAELSIPNPYVFITAGQTIGNTEKEIGSLVNSEFLIRNPYYVNTMVTLNGFGLTNPIQVPAMLVFRDAKVYLLVFKPGVSDWDTLTAVGDSSVTFSCVGDIHVPVWQIN